MNKGNPAYLFIVFAVVGVLYLFSGGGPSRDGFQALPNPKKARKSRQGRKTRKKAPRKGRKKLARVYRNLNTGTLSAQYKQPDGTWKVKAHPHQICLRNARFKVNESGRDRVRREGVKNVHAVIEGEVVDKKSIHGKLITYDPYTHDHFETKDGKEVFEADEVCVNSKGKITARGAK
jgi:hypothetical protein